MTENRSEWMDRVDSKDIDDTNGGNGVLTLVPNCGGFHSDRHGDEIQVTKGDERKKQLDFLLGEQDLSNCGTLMHGGESKELSREMEDRLGNRGSSPETENDLGKEVFVHNDRNNYLDNDGTGIEGHIDIWPPSHQQPVPQKPGVILLGRGNSFSLGRSEVILLHNRPKARSPRHRKSEKSGTVSSNDEKLVTIDESRVSVESDDVLRLNRTTEGGDRIEPDYYQTIPSSSPPPVSNGLSHPVSQQTLLNRDNPNEDSSSRIIQLVPCYEDDLQNLWLKAESMMSRRKDKVRKILEEFGIGEPGGGGGEDKNYWEDEDLEERKKEEEEVWQIIQES